MNQNRAQRPCSATSQLEICEVLILATPLGRSPALLGTVTTVLLDMGLHCLFGVASGVNYMAHRDVSVMCRGFVAPCLVILGGLLVMKRRMFQVFCNVFVVSCSLLRHEIFSG